jgi:hypothetical protein
VVTMNGTVSWDVPPCTPEVHGRFGGKYCLHILSQKVSQARQRHCHLLLAGNLLGLLFDREDGGSMFL